MPQICSNYSNLLKIIFQKKAFSNVPIIFHSSPHPSQLCAAETMSICGSEVNAPDMGLTLSRYELPPLHLSVLEITNFLTRFLCRRIPRYRVEMFAQGFSNRLLDQLRQVVPISDDPSKETHIFSEISRNPSRQGPYRTSNLHYGEGKFKHFVGEKSDFENLKGFAYEVAVSVYDEYKQEFMTDTMIIEACNEYCLNVAEVLRKFPANMVIRCVEGTVYALFGPNENDEGMLGFQIYPRKDEDNNGDTRENSFGEQPTEDDTQSLLSDITFTKGEVEQISEHSTLSCEKLKREIQQCGRGFPEIPDDFIDIGTVTDDDARSRTSNMPPYRPKLGEDDPENDVYYMDLQLRKAPRYDYVKQKTVWVDEFFIAQRDPKFTAQTFSGTRFGSVKLKSHPYYSQYSDRGAGFYHFTMPSILPSLRLMAAGATCSTMMNELYSKPIPDEEAEKMKDEERNDEKKGDERDEEEEEEGNIKRCDDQDYSD